MLTGRPPRRPALLAEFLASDRLGTLELVPDDRLCAVARVIEEGMKTGKAAPVPQACTEFLATAAKFYQVENPTLRVLSARPIRVREGGWASELFGDYHPGTKVIRAWMRTAVRKQVTSFGTFLSTLPRVLPPPRLRAVRVRRFSTHARLLRTHSRSVPPSPRHRMKCSGQEGLYSQIRSPLKRRFPTVRHNKSDFRKLSE
jgi:hypothetical protein